MIFLLEKAKLTIVRDAQYIVMRVYYVPFLGMLNNIIGVLQDSQMRSKRLAYTKMKIFLKGCHGSVVYNLLKPMNIKLKHYDAHSLRHACATHLINQGISLKVISDHLGHQSMNSTPIYAKVNLTNLRKVADFNIGGLL